MKGMQVLIALALVGVAGRAVGSYDLMLYPGEDGRVHRYDPANRALLGSYDTGAVDYVGADRASGMSYTGTTSGSGLRAFNYSTGALTSVFGSVSQARSIEVSGGHAYVLSTTTLRRVNLTTGAASSYLTSPGVTWQSTSVLGEYVHLYGFNAARSVVIQSFHMPTATFGAVQTTTLAIDTGTNLGKAAAASNSGLDAHRAVLPVVAGGLLLLQNFDLQSSGAFAGATTFTFALSGMTSGVMMPAALPAHTGWYVAGQDSTTASLTRITRYDLFTTPIFRSAHTISTPGGTHVASGPFAPAILLAPEPASLGALALGALTLMRRRRR